MCLTSVPVFFLKLPPCAFIFTSEFSQELCAHPCCHPAAPAWSSAPSGVCVLQRGYPEKQPPPLGLSAYMDDLLLDPSRSLNKLEAHLKLRDNSLASLSLWHSTMSRLLQLGLPSTFPSFGLFFIYEGQLLQRFSCCHGSHASLDIYIAVWAASYLGRTVS